MDDAAGESESSDLLLHLYLRLKLEFHGSTVAIPILAGIALPGSRQGTRRAAPTI